MNARSQIHILCALLGVSAALSTTAFAQQDAPKFQQRLLYVKFPIHAEYETVSADGRSRLAPCKALESDVLRQPVFDVSGWFRKNGASFPKGSVALFSPKAKLLFLSSAEEDLEIAAVSLEPRPLDRMGLFTLDVQILWQEKDKERRSILEVKSAPLVSGQRLEFKVGGASPAEFALEPVVGPDGRLMDMNTEATLGPEGRGGKMDAYGLMEIGRPRELTLESPGSPTVIFRLFVERRVIYSGPPLLETPEKKAAAIKDILSALEKSP